ncbi:hypothetical protein [Phenylobacterium sp.]|uniref:hypothetical protein n=1 Tax=Phenylobacterium sp. TaxID=1871053 RepID=UPI002BAF650C|nr:hypothetical protein [Phenylobacterium sp.]HLZ76579.1 hypothetical protein [Phenylobacterium sp.]
MRRAAVAMGLVLALGLSGVARAGPSTDDLGKCLVKSTTPGDRDSLMTWLFMAISAHPSVKAMANVTPAQRDDADRQIAVVVQRLLTQDCRSQTVDAIRNDGMGAIQGSFTVLGQVAMGGLMQDPAVSGQIQGMAKYLDVQKFTALLTDIGQAPPPAKK